jgi:hypothetical protein
MWMWLAGGGVLVAIIALVVVLVLVLGGGSKQGSARDAALSYWSSMINHDFAAAHALLTPERRAITTVDALRQSQEQLEAVNQIKFTSVDATSDNATGDTAIVPVVMKAADGRTGSATVSLRKIDNKWFVANGGQ